VLERVVAETHGNPLALVELAVRVEPHPARGRVWFAPGCAVSAGIEGSFMRRLATLSQEARRLLLVAVADPVGDSALVWRAAERLGIPESAADTVESEGLLALSPRVVFRHPLVRPSRPAL
jgi:hypothetical protein